MSEPPGSSPTCPPPRTPSVKRHHNLTPPQVAHRYCREADALLSESRLIHIRIHDLIPGLVHVKLVVKSQKNQVILEDPAVFYLDMGPSTSRTLTCQHHLAATNAAFPWSTCENTPSCSRESDLLSGWDPLQPGIKGFCSLTDVQWNT